MLRKQNEKRDEEEFFSDKLFKFPYLIEAPPCVQNPQSVVERNAETREA